MRIDKNGNVGIGTTAPDAPLHASGGTAMTAGWNRTSTLQATYPVQVFNSNATKWAGIGYDFANAMRFWVNASSNDVSNTGTSAMTILNNGNVGIGTTSPGEVLDVIGNARFSAITAGASAGALHYTATGVLTTNTSDRRLKKDIVSLAPTLDKVMQLRSVSFVWKDDPNRKHKDLGFIAQEVEQIFPEIVFTNPNDGYMGVNYDRFISVLTKAMQEQQEIINDLKSENALLKQTDQKREMEIKSLKSDISEIKTMLNQQSKK